jgi:hypothetical protein
VSTHRIDWSDTVHLGKGVVSRLAGRPVAHTAVQRRTASLGRGSFIAGTRGQRALLRFFFNRVRPVPATLIFFLGLEVLSPPVSSHKNASGRGHVPPGPFWLLDQRLALFAGSIDLYVPACIAGVSVFGKTPAVARRRDCADEATARQRAIDSLQHSSEPAVQGCRCAGR